MSLQNYANDIGAGGLLMFSKSVNKSIISTASLQNYANHTPSQVAIISGNDTLAEVIRNHNDNDVLPFRYFGCLDFCLKNN